MIVYILQSEVNVINKQKFLAELGKLLTFMYEEDRQTALAMYSRMFDQAEDEQALLSLLVSPTRQAVVVARAYNAKERRLQVHAQFRDQDGGDYPQDEIPDFVLAIDKIQQSLPLRGEEAAPRFRQSSSVSSRAGTEKRPGPFQRSPEKLRPKILRRMPLPQTRKFRQRGKPRRRMPPRRRKRRRRPAARAGRTRAARKPLPYRRRTRWTLFWLSFPLRTVSLVLMRRPRPRRASC